MKNLISKIRLKDMTDPKRLAFHIGFSILAGSVVGAVAAFVLGYI